MNDTQQWLPIKFAPAHRKVAVHYRNEQGNGRTVFAMYAEHGCVEVVSETGDELVDTIDGADFLPEGWYELIESPYADYTYVPLGGKPTYFMWLMPEPSDNYRCTKCGLMSNDHPVDIDEPGADTQLRCDKPQPDAVAGMRAIRTQYQHDDTPPQRRDALEGLNKTESLIRGITFSTRKHETEALLRIDRIRRALNEPAVPSVSEKVYEDLQTLALEMDDKDRNTVEWCIAWLRKRLQSQSATAKEVMQEWENVRNYILGYGGWIPSADELNRIDYALEQKNSAENKHSSAVPTGYIERLQNERDEALAERNELRRQLSEPAVPSVSEDVRQFPTRLRSVCDPCQPGYAIRNLRGVVLNLADELERAIAQHESRVLEELTTDEVLSRAGPPFDLVKAEYFAGGWNACRRAMLAAAPEPDGEKNDG